MYFAVLALSPLLDLSLVLLDPILDPICEGIAKGVVNVFDAYEKTKPPTGLVHKCSVPTSCPKRYANCPNYHPITDCEAWIEDKQSCDGHCNKYHRRWVGGRRLTERAKRTPEAVALKPSIFIPEQPIFGRVTLGLQWDIDEHKFGNSGVFSAFGEWRDVNLGAGIFNLNGQLLYMVFSDDDPFCVSTNKTDDHFDFSGGIIHHNGNDQKGGAQGRSKPGNFGYNEAIHIDFNRMPENVGSIVVSVTMANRALLPRLDKCKVAILSTPSFSEDTNTNKLLEVDLEPNGEFQNNSGYIFGKFVRTSAGWKFVPIQLSHGLTTSEMTIQQLMKPLALESTSASLPGPLEVFDIRTISLSKDRTSIIHIKKIGFVCFDTFGEKMAIDDPFLVSISQFGDYEFKYKGSARFLKTIVVYVEHQDPLPVGVNIFVVGTGTEPIICNVGNIGANAQLVARFVQVVEGEVSRWEVGTYCIPIKKPKTYFNDPDAPAENVPARVADIAYAQRLLPEAGNKLNILLNALAPDAKQLVVQVNSGKRLAVKDMLSSDPFVVVKFARQKCKTGVIKNTTNPSWNATLKFDLEDVQGSGMKVLFRCKDWNKVTSPVSMGVAQFDLMSLVTNYSTHQPITLTLEKDPKHPKQAVAGHIEVNIYFQ